MIVKTQESVHVQIICGWRQKKNTSKQWTKLKLFGPYTSENSINSNSWTSSNFWGGFRAPSILVLRQKVWIVVWKVAAPYLTYSTIPLHSYSYTMTRLPSTWALQPTCLSAASTGHTRQPEYKEGQHTIAACQILINSLDTSLKITQFSIKYDDQVNLSG